MTFYVSLRYGLTRLAPGDMRSGRWEAARDVRGLRANRAWPSLITETPRDPAEFAESEVIPALRQALDRYDPMLGDPWSLYRTVRFDDDAMVEPSGLWPSSPVKRLEMAAVFAAALGDDRVVDEIVDQLPQAADDFGVPHLVPDVLDVIARARRGEFLATAPTS